MLKIDAFGFDASPGHPIVLPGLARTSRAETRRIMKDKAVVQALLQVLDPAERAGIVEVLDWGKQEAAK